MNKIPFAVGQASSVAVMAPNADATFTNATGGASVFAGVGIFKRGKPNTVLLVTSENYQKVLGDAIHPHYGKCFEPYRHVYQALNGGNGYVVRVATKGMKIPLLSLVTAETSEAKDVSGGIKTSLVASNISVGTDVELPDKGIFTIYVDDGDASANRTLSLVKDEESKGMYSLILKQVNALGESTTLENIQIAFTPEATDDTNQPAYLPTALENNSTRLRAIIGDISKLPENYEGFADQPFIGGSDGDMTNVTSESYQQAIKALGGSKIDYTAILSLGCSDLTALTELAKLANDVRVDMFCDLLPASMPDKAIEEAKSQGFGSYAHICRYHFPYSSRDNFSGAQVVYGLSGDAFTAKAKGVAMVADVGGYHLSPAGQSRGILIRQNVKPLAAAAEIDRELYAAAGINTVDCAKDGSVVIDDALTTYSKKNDLRFQHVNSTLNAIARGVYELGKALKHEPDGVTRRGLEREIPKWLDRFCASEALVTPSDPATDGAAPYIVWVEKEASDMWRVKYGVCITGVARRIVAEPVLIP
ncbi:phage tail protein [Yersinia ruckeri]|uniref:phage tail protein n=1 Tax=Yersinia ruckeri TaxID=29486 RepID=UPI0020C11F1E|nr:phage tail protein [Yersinia ruckeri]EKN4689571.1 phage tail protein [Yersinia ruckeri]MCK8586406.1 phage tail protein [Yersinia ruckeri]MCW6615648.1 phage tail protein [Yersinia ruckeri]